MIEGQLTIATAARAMRSSALTPVDLVESCLKQIDRREEKVRAWVFVDREGARAEAERLTAELKTGSDRGPLHGIPIGVKDIFDVFDWPTAAGSKIWAQSYARQDANVIARLRQAGAIFLGKTVTTAYASFDPAITRNPWNLSKTPGGSSSGSAAAVATGMCLGALGSQTGGSIARPAAYCGVCGLKPTYGRSSLAGVVPLAHSMDHVGAMSNSVTDLAILLQGIADANNRRVDQWEVPEPADYVAAINEGPPVLKAGRLRGMFDDQMESAMRPAFEAACARLQKAGLNLLDCPLPATFAEVTARHQLVMAVEAAQFHEQRMRRRPDDYPPRIRSLIEEGMATGAAHYARTKQHQKDATLQIVESFRDGVTVVITPATTGPAPDIGTTGRPLFNSPWSYTGLPTVNIPIAWTDDGLPLSMQLVGRPWEEAKLLQLASWCEGVIRFERRIST